ncbi:MAG: DUF3794 domain-containing protein [Lachnospiraceae bacterium]|nr:DUF3794 domain-containing protein [Lachnospiraceae bacterium]
MELLKQNIHRNGVKHEGELQLTLEEDVNLPETKPDVSTICMEKGQIVLEEVRPIADAVSVKGRLVFSVLYHTQEYGGRLECMEGKLPFEEKIRVDGLLPMDQVCVTGKVEDLTVTMINSRKLSVQSVVTLKAASEGIQDEEVPVGIAGAEQMGIQIHQVPMEFTEICMCKKDVIRVKEEISLPGGYPNISRILWKSVELGEMNFRLGEEKTYVQGEVRIFVLYEGEDGTPQIYETVTEESAELACSGCFEGMALDVRYGISQWELAPRPDVDGEMRDFGLEMTIDLKICVYDDKKLDVVTDIYGVRQEIEEEKKTVGVSHLLRSVTGKTKVASHLKLDSGEKLAQVVHGEAELGPVVQEAAENGLTIRGSLCVKILYVTGEDDKPYGCLRKIIPFEYVLEIPGMTGEENTEQVQADLEQLSVTMLDEEEVDVKAILCFTCVCLREEEAEVLEDAIEMPMDPEKMANLPSMAIYMVRPGEGLWDVGKRYYVPIQSLMDFNELPNEEVRPGQKLFVVRGN